MSCCELKGVFILIHTLFWVYCNIFFQVLTKYFQNLPVYPQSFVTTTLFSNYFTGFCKGVYRYYTIEVENDNTTQPSKQFYRNTAFLTTKIKSLLTMKHIV